MRTREYQAGNYYLYKGNVIQWAIEDYSEIGKNIELLTEPIPLTTEWLKRFGFEYGYDKWLPVQESYKKDDLLLSEDFTMSYFDSYMVTFGNPIQHVHQLQNLYFALTGKEL